MSVLVKGWTIPKGCADCPTWCKLYLQRREFRHPDCPLIEVPTPHGRLGDLDELKKKVLTWLPSDPCGQEEKEFPFETDICVSMLMEIEEAESIIEAEE